MQPFIAAMHRVRQAFCAAVIRSLLRTKSVLQTILDIWISPSKLKGENVESDTSSNVGGGGGKMGGQEFISRVESLFHAATEENRLITLSDGFRTQFLESMEDNPLCMLPSYNHQLPSGEEGGTFLALDVGGSTFRVALIRLLGRRHGEEQESKILTKKTFKINTPVKQLKGVLFFNWMAERIEETLSGQIEGRGIRDSPLSMGLAWSFPVE